MTRILTNNDDFGRTTSINRAIIEAHRSGTLQSASLMVTGSAFTEAVELAREHPTLKVGLHLALSEVPPALPKEEVPHLVNPQGHFHTDPARAGWNLAVSTRAREEARREIQAQFLLFQNTGLPLSHVDGHHHLHMHPFVFDQCLHWGEKLGCPRIRIAREWGTPLPLRRDDTDFFAKTIRHSIFNLLSRWCRRKLRGHSLRALDGVLGLWETGRMNESYLLQCLASLPSGEWEIYFHAGSEDAPEELPALLSPRVLESLTPFLKSNTLQHEKNSVVGMLPR